MNAQASPLALADALAGFIHVLDLDDLIAPDQVGTALRELESQLLLVASEALNAEIGGTRLCDAATDFERFPHLARLHASVEDTITLELPSELVVWARRMFAGAPVEGLDELRTDLVKYAKADPMPLRRALFRFLLFEGVRLNLVFRALLFPHDVFGTGLERDDLDTIAEREVEFWLATTTDLEGVRSFTVMVAAACEVVTHESELLRFALRTVRQELRDGLAARARIEAALASMNAPDALLIRNEHAEEFEIQPLKIDTLRQRHPAAFGKVKRGALYQRQSELAKRRASGGPLIKPRRRLSLLDLVAEHVGADLPKSEVP